MRPRCRLLAAVLAVTLLATCSPSEERVPADEILWDTWGVPHIYGATDEDLFRGHGWAQMESHADLILRLYGETQGRASEYWGEDYLASDRFIRMMGVPGRGAEWLARESEPMRRNIEAFAAGINGYAAAHGDRIDDAVEVVLPVTPADVLSHFNRVIHFTFITNAGVLRQARAALTADAAGPVALERSDGSFGSNAWAIGPSRSASGNAILVANPHLPWSGLFTFYEAQLTGPGVDAYGATLLGLPGILIGFNGRLGWTHTVNTYDGADLFALEREGTGYRFGDEVRDFETYVETIGVLQGDGSLREESLTVRSSIHGPIVAEADGRAVALRVAGLDAPGVAGQWWDMARSQNLEEFESALSRLQIPMFNVIYADADGHILYVFNGSVPRRSTGDVDTWAGTVDGSDPSTLWSQYHSYAELPRVLDPETGWVQNANDPPWTSTVPQALAPEDFPAYLAPLGMNPRPQRSANMLLSDDSITFDEAVAYKHSTVVGVADRVLDELVAAAHASGDPIAAEAALTLEQWDRTTDADSRGGVLFEAWLRPWQRSSSSWRAPWDAQSPTDTPRGIADPAAAVQVLIDAADEVEDRYGALDIAWGEVHRARRGAFDVPVSGGPGYPHGIFRVAGFGRGENGSRQATSGDSFYAVVEFAPEGVRARVLLAYGNSSQLGSPHYGDQLELFARQEMRSAWLTRTEIEANLESRTEY